jgi:mRNA-degrading endonuclease YafQ of YafQ-DinJ toxin-antitoxin module
MPDTATTIYRVITKELVNAAAEPDWLLVYEIKDELLVLMLYRLGTHSELFKK